MCLTTNDLRGWRIEDGERRPDDQAIFPGRPVGANPPAETSQILTSATVKDGETLIVAGFRTQPDGSPGKALLVFVTPTLINPDGKPWYAKATGAEKWQCRGMDRIGLIGPMGRVKF
jgi:hypothetical protein